MQLRRERYLAEYLDPRNRFQRARVPLEVRWDPLTGQSCRLLPEGSIPPPVQHDLEQLAAETRPTCPFCSESLEQQTPRFAPEIASGGRIRCGEAVLFPNLVPYAKWSSVSVYSPELHQLPIEKLTPSLVADNVTTQVEFARAVAARDTESTWISINANQLPPSGSSVFHPHLQGAASPVPTTVQRLLADLPAGAVREYIELERRSNERHIASTGSVEWLASFAPVGPAEIRAYALEIASPAQLDRRVIEEFARGLVAVLRVYSDLGYQSFNLALYGAPPGATQHILALHVVARAYYGPSSRSDAMWSERLHWDAATDVSPEKVAALARATFTAVCR